MNKINTKTKVEYKKLLDITVWDKKFSGIKNNFEKKFKHVSAAKLKEFDDPEGDIKLISTGNFTGYAKRENVKEYINKGEILTIPTGGSANIKYFSGEFVDSGNLIATSIDDEKYNLKYIYYNLLEKNELIESFFRGPSVKHPDMSNILKIKIPIPPIEVQNEIVRILDTFIELKAGLIEELTAELEMRRKQYEFYREELYKFENEKVKYIKLSNIAKIERGGNFHKKHFRKEGKPCIHYGQIYTIYNTNLNKTVSFIDEEIYNESKKAKKGDIIMAVTSENIEDVCKCVVWEGNENVAISGHTAIIDHNINPRYLGYYFSTMEFFKQKVKLAYGTKVIEVLPFRLYNIKIPIPSFSKQQEIVDILDKFEKLCNSLTEGISAEIEMREKQYKYYRNKLLSFK